MTPAIDILSNVIIVYLINEKRTCILIMFSQHRREVIISACYTLLSLMTAGLTHPAGEQHFLETTAYLQTSYETIYSFSCTIFKYFEVKYKILQKYCHMFQCDYRRGLDY
jgi:hypothetical protein